MDFETVKEEYKARKDEFDENFRTRIYRALSWIWQARSEIPDLRFTTLWIGFNAIYAQRIGNQYGDAADRAALRGFLNRICELDDNHLIYDLLWREYSGNVRSLLDCQFIYREFWDYQSGKVSRAAFEEDFARDKDRLRLALERGDTRTMIFTIFDRLYTLRNQIIHGGATCGSQANRRQLQFGTDLLESLDLVILKIMLDNYAREQWGELYYPYIKE